MESRSRSASPGKFASGIYNAPGVQSFGAFLEGNSKSVDVFNKFDLEDPSQAVRAFARWAAGKWDWLHTLFGHEDAKRLPGIRRKVKASEFVAFAREKGF